MDDKKIMNRHCTGSKVSQIANIFQNMAPSKDTSDGVVMRAIKTVPSVPPDSPPITKNDCDPLKDSPTQVTVVRTESHVARFNNARALFEKLGEENQHKGANKMIPLQTTKSASSIHGLRSRSSSANSETSQREVRSRTPSPVTVKRLQDQSNMKNSQLFSNSVPVLNTEPPKCFNKSNGHAGHSINGKSIVDDYDDLGVAPLGVVDKVNENNETVRTLTTTTPTSSSKPIVLPRKPDKPERKFNSRELIEKQRNWTSHFSKARSTSSRYYSDPNKNEVRIGLNTQSSNNILNSNSNQSVDNTNRSILNQPAMRSASFSARLRSPPTSPPPPPIRTESSKRSVCARRERPASVIPTQDFNFDNYSVAKTKSSSSSPESQVIKTVESPIKSPTLCDDYDNKMIDTVLRSPLKTKLSESHQKPSSIDHNVLPRSPSSHLTYSPTKENCSRPLSSSSLSPKSPIGVTKSLDDSNKENLSATSGSLSSLSSPSSPSKQKTEDEKQEKESNEKLLASDTTEGRKLDCLEKEHNEVDKKSPRDHQTNNERGEQAADIPQIQKRTKMVSSIALNIPAVGLGTRPASIISTNSTLDEGGFNEPSPEVKAKLKPHADDSDETLIGTMSPSQSSFEDSNSKTLIASDSLTQQRSVDSDIIYQVQPHVKNSVLTKLDSNDNDSLSATTEEFLQKERSDAMQPLYIDTEHRQNTSKQEEEKAISIKESTETTNHDNKLLQCSNSSSSICDQKIISANNINTQRDHLPHDVGDDDDGKIEEEESSMELSSSFLVSRTVLREDTDYDTQQTIITDFKESEASILDLQDVQFADAESDDETSGKGKSLDTDDNDDTNTSHIDKKVLPEADTMTPDEAENLLSSSILEKKIRQEALLSDEEAQEVVRLLSPSDKTTCEPEWLSEVISSAPNSTMNDSVMTVDSVTTVDSSPSRLTGSVTGSESGIIGSVASLTEQDDEEDAKQEDFVPIPGKIIIIENGVHYYEDGHFWMEVPGLPDSAEEEDDLDYPIYVKKNTKVTFSTGPMKVYSTFSVNDYDRRNEDVDPVAASAEYELEKRVEKMEVFPVELIKGPEGLGLSIIGMGVGADAGLEKLGIFVKTITENGAAARDGRIQVNDQIIEVDGKSLVGVTQAYAASVLRNTSGLVKFLIGREKDPQNSEVAQLIRQSLQADREREERCRSIKSLQNDVSQSEDNSASTLPLNSSTNTSISEEPSSPSITGDGLFENEQTNNDVDSLRQLLQEHKELMELESSGTEKDDISEKLRQTSIRLRETERNLHSAKKEVATFQDMLEQSQTQYSALEKKYNKAKKLVREFQQRELDMVHREEFYQQLLQEKDTEYNALVKNLKDRVISLEQELLDTQQKAGLPIRLPYDSVNSKPLTPQMTRRQAPKPLFQQLETELSDTEISDISPDEGDKTATVERKMPVKEELDNAIPQHELLDVSANKSKGELGMKGGLANRQLPSGKKGSLSNSSSEHTLDESYGETSCDDESMEIGINSQSDVAYSSDSLTSPNMSTNSTVTTQIQRPTSLTNIAATQKQQYKLTSQQQYQIRQENINALYSHVNKEHHHNLRNDNKKEERLYATVDPESSESWSNSRNYSTNKILGPPASLAEQLKQVLAEREKRLGDNSSSRDTLADYSEIKPNPTLVTQHLVEEIRMAVNEANARVKKVVPQTLSPPGSVPWQQQNEAPPSPSSLSSGSTSPSGLSPIRHDISWSPPHPSDLNLSISSGGSDKKSHFWQSAPVSEWSKEQVCQWLLALGLEQHISKFLEHQVGGMALLQLESRDFKILGVNGDDKNRLKRKLKELKVQVEKEKRQMEKERKEKEKLLRKAEKLAEKASKKKVWLNHPSTGIYQEIGRRDAQKLPGDGHLKGKSKEREKHGERQKPWKKTGESGNSLLKSDVPYGIQGYMQCNFK
ncbi:uncharacterized protein LOC123299078 isoform X4 [Chrysoperla carnea]|uniref:uncharacterized protein LOC123299078 isoform X4 n=1 Tax=Chrysoperla carnea TaxID=189513 RepID=UPI001D077BA1|nr:uncharacterized protein LOC123299078 isoform X4 [Chrysoperla carnea]